ncbi:MAG TPA: urea ABC transporter ATP-binding protein UrtD [Acidiferrobacter sp.]|nr:urea ABC transporter ATP-binding protein UrtD [Acidiferrobacter sp.]
MTKGRSLLEVSGVSVSFNGHRALDNLSFVMYEGELAVIIGPNGAGKTTLLDIVSGRTAADEGTVVFDGRAITGMADFRIARLGIARKFQTPSVFPGLTVGDNLVLAGRRQRGVWATLVRGLRDSNQAHYDSILERIGLAHRRDTLAGTLAHGEKQWLEIGMVLAGRPRLMLIDEPIAGMTAQEATKTAELLREIAQDCSVLVVEHDMDFVKTIADRVSVFHQGRLLIEGSFDRVSHDPHVREIYLGPEPAHA